MAHGSFRVRSPTWPATVELSVEEVRQSLEPGRISRIALDGAGHVLGWIGGHPSYDGRVWELHPLAVDAAHRMQGVGRALVQDLERLVAEQGALTLFLGTDDEANETSLANADLYVDLFDKLQNIRNLRGHPYEFYQRLGFQIVGVLPDADGRGKPDIFMAKAINRTRE